MIEHPGITFLLSFLLVIAAALVLYRREPAARTPDEANEVEAGADEPRPGSGGPAVTSPLGPSSPVPEPTPGVAWRDGVDPATKPAVQPSTATTAPRSGNSRVRLDRPQSEDRSEGIGQARSERPTTAGASKAATSRARVVSRPGGRVARNPEAPFTLVEEGETLADVAARVYGSADEVETLWRANRDLLDRVDQALRTGAVLRTPARR